MNYLERIFFLISIIAVSALQMYAFQFRGFSVWLILSVLPSVLIHTVTLFLRQTSLRKYLSFYGYTVLLCGPFSSLGCFLILCLKPSLSKRLINNYRDFLAIDSSLSAHEKIDFDMVKDYWSEESDHITPFIDIMSGTNSEKKRDTINKVVQHPSIHSKQILDIGLKDNDQDIRFYAASALIMLNDNFVDTFKEYLEKIKTSPNHADFYLKLAISYDKYCSWNLPESEDLPGYYDKIEAACRKVLSIKPNNFQAILGLGKVLLNKKKFFEAEEVLNQGIRLYPGSQKMAYYKMETLYQQQKFNELHQVAKNFRSRYRHFNLETEEVVKYWENDTHKPAASTKCI